MNYQVHFSPTAYRQLAELPKQDQRRIREKIDRLAKNPRPRGVKVLHGRGGFLRIRAGDYRIVYTVEDDRLMVLVIRIGHRREVYRAM